MESSQIKTKKEEMSVSESPICTGQKWTVVLSKPWICSKKFKETMSGEKKKSIYNIMIKWNFLLHLLLPKLIFMIEEGEYEGN